MLPRDEVNSLSHYYYVIFRPSGVLISGVANMAQEKSRTRQALRFKWGAKSPNSKGAAGIAGGAFGCRSLAA
jgi:hypothetical protein